MFNIAQSTKMPEIPSGVKISEKAHAFLKQCFERNPRKRANVRQLLNHPWVQRGSAINGLMVSLHLSPIEEVNEDLEMYNVNETIPKSLTFDRTTNKQHKEELIKNRRHTVDYPNQNYLYKDLEYPEMLPNIKITDFNGDNDKLIEDVFLPKEPSP